MKKKIILVLQLVVAILLVCTSIYAAVSTTIDITPSETSVKAGDEVTVKLSLKNVDSSKKVSSVKGYINYDTNIIETITVDNIEKSSSNQVTIGGQTLPVEDLTNTTIANMTSTSSYVGFNGNPTTDNQSLIVIDFAQDVSLDTDLITIKFKVKSTATVGEIEKAIEYKAFIVTAGGEESEEISKYVKLTVNAASTDNNNTNTNNTNTNTNNTNTNNTNTNTNNTNTNTNNTNTNTNNTNTNTNRNTNRNNTNTNTNNTNTNNTNKNTSNTNTNVNSVDNTTAKKVIPATGSKILILPALALIVVAYVFYNRYMKYKNV